MNRRAFGPERAQILDSSFWMHLGFQHDEEEDRGSYHKEHQRSVLAALIANGIGGLPQGTFNVLACRRQFAQRVPRNHAACAAADTVVEHRSAAKKHKCASRHHCALE